MSNMESLQDQPLERLTVNGCNVTLLGTAHVSRASADAVQALIDTGEYDAVAVELCKARYDSITNPDLLAKMDLFEVIKQGKANVVAASLALGAYQQKIAEQFDVQPGAEMRVAIAGAETQGLDLHLIDRDIGLTMKRVYRNIPWWRKMYLMSGMVGSVFVREDVKEEDIEKLKSGDMLESTFEQFSDSASDLYVPLIHERDQYMAGKIRLLTQEAASKNLLVVIGAGHLAGIVEILSSEQPVEQEIPHLESVPPKSKWVGYIPWAIVALIIGGFGLGFYKSPDLGWHLVGYWIVINGGLSSLGAAIAGAHILTIVTAFLAAPLTSLNPTIGAGVVTAGAELYLRKPEVKHFDSLRQDTMSFAGWRSNRVARVILVFLLSTIGSAIGTYVAGYEILDSVRSAY